MSPIYGDLQILGQGRILGLRTELGDSLPTFDEDDAGRLFFIDGALKLNDGNEWVTIQLSNTDISNPLLVTLGTNWINVDLSFNPTPFNALNNVSGLDSNDSLFSVFQAFDTAISSLSSQHLASLGDTAFAGLQDGDLVIWNGSEFSNTSLNSLANARLSLTTASLKDISVSAYAAGDTLVFSHSANKLVNRQTSFTYTNTATDSEFLVEHNLGVQFPLVQVINAQTNHMIVDNYDVSYDSVNSLTVSLVVSSPVIILVYALNPA